jgi:hypothetical protein
MVTKKPRRSPCDFSHALPPLTDPLIKSYLFLPEGSCETVHTPPYILVRLLSLGVMRIESMPWDTSGHYGTIVVWVRNTSEKL